MQFMQIKPQKARGTLKPEMWTSTQWVAEVKYDGDRRIGQFIDGRVRFTGTRESVDGAGFVEKSANLPHLSDGARGARQLDGTVLDGEIIALFAKDLPGGKSKYVTSIMGSRPEEAIKKQQEHGWLEWVVFDCLWYRGADVRGEYLRERQLLAKQALTKWENPHARPVEQVTGALKEKYFKTLLIEGEEGVILKHLSHTYGDERLWVKVKGAWTADVVVMGFEPGKGRYKGQIGAMVFGQYGHGPYTRNEVLRMGTCRGFTDAQMRTMSKKDIGRVFQIKHNGREPTGAFRHPRFDRWRDDKSPVDCVYRENET